jgi:hypothetical protein
MYFLAFIWLSVIDFVLESNIEDFIQSLKHQNILLEVDDFANRNGTEGLSYNGAIIVSGKQKVCLPLEFCFYENTHTHLHMVRKCNILTEKLEKVNQSGISHLNLKNILTPY